MAGREQPYDPYIPSGSSGQGGNSQYEGGNTRTAAIQSVRANICISNGYPVFGVLAPSHSLLFGYSTGLGCGHSRGE